MVNEELKKTFAKMTRREINEVKTYLNQIYKTAREEDLARYRKYKEMVEEIWDRKITKTRQSDNVWMRAMIAYAMRREGVTTLSIGKCMGLNHSSVSNCLDKITSMEEYPSMYLDIMDKWTNFKTMIV